jgi:hypothetical protein
MHFTMMLFAERVSQFRIVLPPNRVVCLNAQNAGRNRSTLALPFLPLCLSPRCADWILILHAAPPLNVRYSEKSDSTGSVALIVRGSVSKPRPPSLTLLHFSSVVSFSR